jgi:tRNA1(Val) A37 N6-methylase TrmN6
LFFFVSNSPYNWFNGAIMATQEIYVLNKRLKLLHSEKGFKTSMDSVLLAAACRAKSGDHILDIGCGVGGAGLCVLTRVDGVKLTGVEIQEDHAELARQNAKVNGMQERCTFVNADICEYREEKAFNHIICNPPYLEAEAHLRSPSKEKATAMGHEDREVSVKEWVDCAYFCLKSNGTFTMIHRADKVDKIILAMGKRFGAIEIIPLWPKVGKNAKRVIVRAIKDRKSPATIHAGITLHNDDGEYSYVAEKILREMETI